MTSIRADGYIKMEARFFEALGKLLEEMEKNNIAPSIWNHCIVHLNYG